MLVNTVTETCLSEQIQVSSHMYIPYWGWSGGAMVLGKLPVPGRPTCLD